MLTDCGCQDLVMFKMSMALVESVIQMLSQDALIQELQIIMQMQLSMMDHVFIQHLLQI